MPILFTDRLDIVLDVDKYILNGYTTCGRLISSICRLLGQHNDGVNYLLTCIDTFSKYAWVRPLKNKSRLCVKEAFESISEEKISLYLQTDKGTEFKNTLFQGQLTEYKMKFYTSENDDIKALYWKDST